MLKSILSIFIFITIIFVGESAMAQTISNSLFEGKRDSLRNEINAIEFEGNKTFPDERLYSLLSVKETKRSMVHSSMQYYYDQMSRIEATPEIILRAIYDNLSTMEHQINYFQPELLKADIETMWHFYNINGFHFVDIKYEFVPDSTNKINILRYIIDEGPRFSLAAIIYKGLDSIDNSTKQRIEKITNRKHKHYFDENALMNDINQVHNILLNNGYFFTNYERPNVTMDTVNFRDSVIVQFNTGKRQKIGEIRIEETLNNQKVVVASMKRRQLEFSKGDWYSRQKISKSEQNLNSLGTFTSVVIDTTSKFGEISDTTLNFIIYLYYRQQNNWGIGMFVNRTTLNDNLNTGFEGTWSHKNIFGAAQQIEFFANVSINDFPLIFKEQGFAGTEKSGRFGFRFNQPLLWNISVWRIGLSSSPSFSASLIENLRLNTLNIPVKFPAELPSFTVFSNVSFDFTIESQNPVNFATVRRRAEEDGGSGSIFARSLFIYEDLYNFFQGKSDFALTANLFGISAVGDRRNNPFSPTSGYFLYSSAEMTNYAFSFMGAGLAKMIRINGQLSYFYSTNNLSVYAFKFRGGAIKLLESGNSYVPIDRQFFAGGANSVRGWGTRQLHYSNKKPSADLSESEYEFLSNVLGSGVLIEGSLEFRYRFERYKNFSDFIAEQIANIGVTAFIDFGNAFHWFAEESDSATDIKPLDYITKLAWATGMGFRYETPIGPLRLDLALPVYGPVFGKSDLIINRNNVLGDLQFYIGIGHAF